MIARFTLRITEINMSKNLLVLIPVMALTLAACKPEESAPAAGAPAAEAVVKVEKNDPAAPAAKPDPAYVKKDTYFKVPAVAGGDLDLAAYSGKPVMFMLYTETCPFCRKAGPALEKMHKQYAARGLTVLGLCIQDDPRAAKNFAESLGVSFPMGYGAREVYRQYRAQGVPYIFLLNKSHEAVAVWPGFDASFEGQMMQAIETALSK